MLLAQIAEHIERGNPFAQTIFVCFEKALSLVRDDHLRNEIEMLLTECLSSSFVETAFRQPAPAISRRYP